MIIVLRLRRESPKYLDLNADLLTLPIIALKQDILFPYNPTHAIDG